jgi:hypothetical protein
MFTFAARSPFWHLAGRLALYASYELIIIRIIIIMATNARKELGASWGWAAAADYGKDGSEAETS